jgi:meiotic recombination protein REC8, fungi type
MDLDIPQIYNLLDEGATALNTLARPQIQSSPTMHPSSSQYQGEEPSSAASAPLRKRPRAPKPLPMDSTIELRNRDLLAWSSSYVSNMREAAKVSLPRKAPIQAKKNAEFWILGSGINGVGVGIGGSKMEGPLSMFAGASLYEMITGTPLSSLSTVAGQKRPAVATSDTEGRRVRPRSGEDQIGRGVPPEDEEGILPLYGDETEFPREAQAGLDDISSTMPWNMSGGRGSSIARGIRGSSATRTVQPSPSLRPHVTRPGAAGARLSMLEKTPLPSAPGLSSEGPGFDNFGQGAGPVVYDEEGAAEPFQLDMPQPLDTQTSTQQRLALDVESSNFLSFVEQGVEDKRSAALRAAQLGTETTADVDSISLEELLPPAATTRAVAAQALLHVLSLVTKGLMGVAQRGAFGPIGLRPVPVEAAA